MIHRRQRPHTQNSPTTSKISCHTSQLVRTRGGDYKSSTSKDQTYPQNNKEIHTQHTSSTQVHREFTTQTPIFELRPPILGPVGYGLTTLPLRHFDRTNQLLIHQVVQLTSLYTYIGCSSFDSRSIGYVIHHFFTAIQATTLSPSYSADTIPEEETRIFTQNKTRTRHG